MIASSPSLTLYKELLIRRCLEAVAISVGLQFLLLTVFLLFVNFHIFHPIKWIMTTFGLVWSLDTWILIIPLVTAVVLYGILLGKMHLAEKHYYPSRYHWLLDNASRKLIFLITHVLVGFLTAWLYTKYLHADYRHLISNCYDQRCINSHYTFLISLGMFTGFFQFVKSHMSNDMTTDFLLVQENCFLQIRALLFSTLFKSLFKSFTSTIIFALSYWIFGGLFNTLVGQMFAANQDERLVNFFAIACNTRLLFYAWVLGSQIMWNMHLMQRICIVLLGKPLPFVITKSNLSLDNNSELRLVDALGTSKVFIIQNLAAQFLFQMSIKEASAQRSEIFQLSQPGNHPVNWKQLSGQCLSILQAFTEELSESMKHISAMKNSQVYMPIIAPNAQVLAEKILLRQYNEKHGIRTMVSPVQQPASPRIQRCANNVMPTAYISNSCQRLNARCEEISRQLQTKFDNFVRSIPGMIYFFGEPDGAKTIFLLNNSLLIVFLTQGLAGICAASLKEDRFGIVQYDLPDLIRTLVNLKTELNKLNNININGKRLDRSFHTIKMALKRSLLLICNAFGDHLRDVIPDPQQLRQLQGILNYQDS